MGLAEAMVARGFGATRSEPQRPRIVAGLALALGLTFGGWIVALWWGLPGWILMGAGIALTIALIWFSARRVLVTHYRPHPWRLQDSLLVIAALAPLVLLSVPIEGIDRASLYYSFLPQIEWPQFDPLIGSLLLLFMLPALVSLSGYAARRAQYYDHH
jgi:energy-coupling factor transport system permease protein